jgi:preprotein translocase SecE subunit
MASITKFLRETKAEMKHVIWPTKPKAVIYALVVIIFSVALGYLLFGFDQLFQIGLRSVLF